MNVEKIIAIAIICAVLLVILRHSRPEQGMILSLAAVAILLYWILDDMIPVLDGLQKMTQQFQLSEEKMQILLKTLGLCFLTQTAADVCRDAGEGSLASKVELAGKTAVLLLCLPLYQELLELAAKLIL